MSAEIALTHCPLCGEPAAITHQVRLVWETAPWEGTGRAGESVEPHERWVPVCAPCSSAAAFFRSDYPRQAKRHRATSMMLVGLLGVGLALMLVVQYLGAHLTNSSPLNPKLMLSLAWLILAALIIWAILLGQKLIAFELGSRRIWSHAWLESRLPIVLALPQGDRAPYWWRLDLFAGFEVREIPPPPPPPPPIPLETNIFVGPGMY
ncbi:MAG: hypothetical protein ABI743_02390 [bacterium]